MECTTAAANRTGSMFQSCMHTIAVGGFKLVVPLLSPSNREGFKKWDFNMIKGMGFTVLSLL